MSFRCEVGQYLPSWRPNIDYRKSVSAQNVLGGGVLLELSHELDYLGWIFGEVEWVRATLSRQSNLEIDVEDSAFIVMKFLSDFPGASLIGTVQMDFIRHDSTRLCYAIGDKGTLLWNGLTGEVSISQCGPTQKWKCLYKSLDDIDVSYIKEMENFIKSVEGVQKPLVNGEDGFRVMRIIEAIRSSSALYGRTCKVRK
jgi:predicted dehydrogenase